jgi:hypothetical protein
MSEINPRISRTGYGRGFREKPSKIEEVLLLE